MALTPTTSIPLGFTAPDFLLPDTVSGAVCSRDEWMTGGPTVVAFICNHCPYVVHLLDGFVKVAKSYGQRGVQFVAISSNDVQRYPMDGPKEMKTLATEYAFDFPYLFDETQETAKAYGAACTPDFSIFDASKTCVYRGRFDASRPGNGIPVTGSDLTAALDLLLAGKKVPEDNQPASMGCNIKWKE